MDFLSILYAPMRKLVAKAKCEAAKLRVTAAVVDLAGQTRIAFYRVQADEEMLEMFQQIVLRNAGCLRIYPTGCRSRQYPRT